MKRDDILAALPKLPQEDLTVIQYTINTLLNGRVLKAAGGPHGQGASLIPKTLFGSLVTALGQPKTPFQGNPATQFAKRVPELLAFLNEHFEGWDKNKVSQEAFMRMMFGLLADDLREREVKPSLMIMINNLGRLKSVFDAAFPSYLDSGLGSVLLEKFAVKSPHRRRVTT